MEAPRLLVEAPRLPGASPGASLAAPLPHGGAPLAGRGRSVGGFLGPQLLDTVLNLVEQVGESTAQRLKDI